MTLLALLLTTAFADEGENLGLKWTRDSIEQQVLTTSVYQAATQALPKKLKGKAVVLDVDETVLDNSTYQLERVTYEQSYESASWHAWCERRRAAAVTGAAAFLDEVRKRGGKVAFVTNRKVAVTEATADNLRAEGLMSEGDVLCLRDADSDKTPRRNAIRTGEGACSFGAPVEVAMYFGDTITDFPAAGEEDVDWTAQFGVRYFVLPNPMYGEWTEAVTRTALE